MSNGAAGRRGDSVRSDLWVALEIGDAGGIEIDLTSRVAAYFGDAIRDQVAALLDTLGVPHARVELQDMGALPFTIAARVEAAALRAGVAPAGDARPAVTAPAAPPSGERAEILHQRRPVPA